MVALDDDLWAQVEKAMDAKGLLAMVTARYLEVIDLEDQMIQVGPPARSTEGDSPDTQ